MRKIKPINYKKIMHKATQVTGGMGAILTIMLFAFHIFATQKQIWSSAAERVNYDTITLTISVVSLVLLIGSMILDDRAE